MPEQVAKRKIQTVIGSTFNMLVLDGKGPIVVEFMAYGCSHCRIIAPIMERVAAMIDFKEQIFMVNVAVDPELAERYDIQGTPTFIMFRDGQAIGMIEGLEPDVSSVVTALTQPFK